MSQFRSSRFRPARESGGLGAHTISVNPLNAEILFIGPPVPARMTASRGRDDDRALPIFLLV